MVWQTNCRKNLPTDRVKPPKAVFTADTGAQVDCVARNQLKRLGLSEQDLLEASVALGCTNDTKAGVLGAF